ncbi:MAG: hypothetical protein ABIF71_16065, partial [Planctomycetota bacterium]
GRKIMSLPGVRGLVAGANHGSYTSLMMRQCLTCLSNHHSAPHAKWIDYLFTGTNHPNRPMVDSRAWLTPKSAKAFSAGIRKSAVPVR